MQKSNDLGLATYTVEDLVNELGKRSRVVVVGLDLENEKGSQDFFYQNGYFADVLGKLRAMTIRYEMLYKEHMKEELYPDDEY